MHYPVNICCFCYKQMVSFIYLFFLADVERYSDKYQNMEPSDNTNEWSPGKCFIWECMFPNIKGLNVLLKLDLRCY